MRPRLLIPLIATLAACDLPTEAPVFDTVWEVTMVQDSIRTSDLLPDDMTLDERGFVLDSFSFQRSVRLDEVCELCTCFSGPIPELELEETDFRVQLPAGLFDATLASGTARLALTNRMGFDLLDNGAGRTGVLRVQLVDASFGGRGVLQTIESTASFPTDSTLVLEFDLADVPLSTNLVARVGGTTPGSSCTDLELDPQDGLEADIRFENVVTPEARVILADADVAIDPEVIEIPTFVADRLRPGDAELIATVEIASSVPTAVELNLSVARSRALLHGPEAALVTPVELDAGAVGGEAAFARSFLIDVDDLVGLAELHFDARNRIAGSRIVTLSGRERVAWEITLRATLPSR